MVGLVAITCTRTPAPGTKSPASQPRFESPPVHSAATNPWVAPKNPCVRSASPGRIEAEVKRIVKEQLDVDEESICLNSSFVDDLGADSLGLVELVLAAEEAFEIDIPDDDAQTIRTVGDAIAYIEKFARSRASSTVNF